MRVTVADDSPDRDSGLRARVEKLLRLQLGALVPRVRSVTVRVSESDDPRGRFRCSVTLQAEGGGESVTTSVYESARAEALTRALSRVAKTTARRLREGRL